MLAEAEAVLPAASRATARSVRLVTGEAKGTEAVQRDGPPAAEVDPSTAPVHDKVTATVPEVSDVVTV